MAQVAAPKSIYAGTGERSGALLLDLLLLAFALAAAAPFIAELEPYGPILILLLLLLYFAGLPLTALQGTLGRRIVGTKICGRNGRRLHWRASLVRAGAIIGWVELASYAFQSDLPILSTYPVKTAIFVVIFLPWAPAAFLPRRQSLFDLLAGTLVVRAKADEAAISQDDGGSPRIGEGIATTVLCMLTGAGASVFVFAYQDMDRRGRVVYAIGQTGPLRERIEAFRGSEARWPSAADLGITEFTPFPAGGGYRLESDGSIRISFSKLKELKGHEVIQRPIAAAAGGKIRWQCSADPGMKRGYLPPSCRDTAG
jgi:uncharacterized RDD family membrane protein YckC